MAEAIAKAVNGKGKNFKWVMLLFASLFLFLVNGFIYTSFNVLVVTIARDLGWDNFQRSFVITGFPTGMVWVVFVAGVALDKLSVKKMCASMALIAAVTVFLRQFVKDSTGFYFLMFAYGAALAFILPAITKIIGLWFGREQLAIANGIFTAASPLGQVSGNLLSAPIMAALGGWRQLFTMQSILLVVLVIFFFIIGRTGETWRRLCRLIKLNPQKISE